jgi:hypothetical protein
VPLLQHPLFWLLAINSIQMMQRSTLGMITLFMLRTNGPPALHVLAGLAIQWSLLLLSDSNVWTSFWICTSAIPRATAMVIESMTRSNYRPKSERWRARCRRAIKTMVTFDDDELLEQLSMQSASCEDKWSLRESIYGIAQSLAAHTNLDKTHPKQDVGENTAEGREPDILPAIYIEAMKAATKSGERSNGSSF